MKQLNVESPATAMLQEGAVSAIALPGNDPSGQPYGALPRLSPYLSGSGEGFEPSLTPVQAASAANRADRERQAAEEDLAHTYSHNTVNLAELFGEGAALRLEATRNVHSAQQRIASAERLAANMRELATPFYRLLGRSFLRLANLI